MNDLSPTPLPDSVQEIADVIGRDKALYLVSQLPPYPSTPWKAVVYIQKPANLRPDSDLVRILGWHDALRMSRHFGGALLNVSKCKGLERGARNRAIWARRAQGATAAQIADELDLKLDLVRKVIETRPSRRHAKSGNSDRETANG